MTTQRIFLAFSLFLLTISCSSSDGSEGSKFVAVMENNSQVELVEAVVQQPNMEIIEIPKQVYAGDSFEAVVSSDGGLLGSIKIFGRSTPLLLIGNDLLSSQVAVPIEQQSGAVMIELSITGINWRVTEVIPVEILERPVKVDRIYRTQEMIRIATDGTSYAEEADLRRQQAKTYSAHRYTSEFMQIPVVGEVSTFFGDMRAYENGPPSNSHSGVDFAAPKGTRVSASAGGYVIYSATMPVRGTSVVIDHGSGVFSGYHHLSKVYSPVGAWINAGEYLGEVGSTGFSTGPHLHWEVLVYGTPTDPVKWLESGLSLTDPH